MHLLFQSSSLPDRLGDLFFSLFVHKSVTLGASIAWVPLMLHSRISFSLAQPVAGALVTV